MGDDVIGCMRVGPGMIALGSVRRVCADCGAEVFVAPSGVKLIGRGVVPVCLACLAARVEADGAPEFKAPSAEQVAEAMATFAHYGRRN